MKIIEPLCAETRVNKTLQHATSRLLANGARFVEEALRDNPDGPVTMITELGACDVTYEVVVGCVDAGDRGKSRTVWHRDVVFGQTDRTVAGGHDFVQAARTQEEVAWSLMALINNRSESSR